MNDTIPTPPISEARVEANRQNSLKSTGPNDSTSTRYNAVKHGLRAQGVTELDDPEVYRNLLTALRTEFNPAGLMENFLVERIALGMIRAKRAARLEAEHVTASLNPPITRRVETDMDRLVEEMQGKVEVLDPGLPASLQAATVSDLADCFSRYETMAENRLLRALTQLRQMQSERLAASKTSNNKPAVASFGNPAPADSPAT